METIERIAVFIRTVKGKTICICHAENKMCDRPCEKDTVTRDKFEGWEKMIQRNKYGK